MAAKPEFLSAATAARGIHLYFLIQLFDLGQVAFDLDVFLLFFGWQLLQAFHAHE
ncbi:MAG: hypothetical protein NTZ16_12535 [Verrucomicrobia bacterium]|nr:hypothetical protein [Verrucomicrobiota bacterium]